MRIQRKNDPSIGTELELFQSVIIPAAVGAYELINLIGGQATVCQLRWKQG